jgi:hypothetical protein
VFEMDVLRIDTILLNITRIVEMKELIMRVFVMKLFIIWL